MAVTITGERTPKYLGESASARAHARFSNSVAYGLLVVTALAVLAAWNVSLRPSQVPFLVAVHDDGSMAPLTQALTANDGVKRRFVGEWIACWRRGPSDAPCVKQVAQGIPGGASDVSKTVQDYNQEVADSGATVTPDVQRVTATATGYDVTESETVTVPGKDPEVRLNHFEIALTHDDAHVNLADSYLNAFGLYVTALSQRGVSNVSAR